MRSATDTLLNQKKVFVRHASHGLVAVMGADVHVLEETLEASNEDGYFLLVRHLFLLGFGKSLQQRHGSFALATVCTLLLLVYIRLSDQE